MFVTGPKNVSPGQGQRSKVNAFLTDFVDSEKVAYYCEVGRDSEPMRVSLYQDNYKPLLHH